MKVGDLVEHAPSEKTLAGQLYKDWGHHKDFQAGIIIQKKESFRRVLPASTGAKPVWYTIDELNLLSAACCFAASEGEKK
jgi:hypothetical protein